MPLKLDPKKVGPKMTWSFYCPVALKEAVEQASVEDGYNSSSGYLVELLCAGLNARALDRAAEARAHNKKA